ncbi:unnamed protein product, partial [Didymodactylos carnosus]
GFLYRQYKPVYWSPSVQSALAESELEYNDKHKRFVTKHNKYFKLLLYYFSVSMAIYVRFRVQDSIVSLVSGSTDLSNLPLYVLIWTTTPWSLIANEAVAVNEKLQYAFLKTVDNDIYIVSESLVENVKKLEPFIDSKVIGYCT